MQRISEKIYTVISGQDGIKKLKKALMDAKGKFCGPDKPALFGKSEHDDHNEKAVARYAAAGFYGIDDAGLSVLLKFLSDPEGSVGKNSLKTFVLKELHKLAVPSITPEEQSQIDYNTVNVQLRERLAKKGDYLEMELVKSVMAYLEQNTSDVAAMSVGISVQKGLKKYKELDSQPGKTRHYEQETGYDFSDFTKSTHTTKKKEEPSFTTDGLMTKVKLTFRNVSKIQKINKENYISELKKVLSDIIGKETSTSLKGLVIKELFSNCSSGISGELKQKIENGLKFGELNLERVNRLLLEELGLFEKNPPKKTLTASPSAPTKKQ